MQIIQSIRGMPDILPQDISLWQKFEAISKSVLNSYSYQEIRLPLVEETSLFARSVGTDTDIVNKEMYTFDDRDGRSITLRPEGTASCVRAGIEHGMFYNQTQRLWYSGPMFRYERPQKGRYRQFHQLGIEAFGFDTVDIAIEQFCLIARLWQCLSLQDKITLEINHLGAIADRAEYTRALVQYFQKNSEILTEDQLQRLAKNPLRLLDSKDQNLQELIAQAPKLSDYISDSAKQELEFIQTKLSELNLGIKISINPRLVRGLDYYTGLVYEWVTTHLGSQGAVCAGGQFDNLVEQLGGSPTPAIGLAIGLERVMLLMSANGISDVTTADIYIVACGEHGAFKKFELAELLRTELSQVRVQMHCGNEKFKNQFKRADRSGARIVVILGDEEAAAQTFSIKYMRDPEAKNPQITVPWENGVQVLKEYFKDLV